MYKKTILDILKREMAPALGVTEPSSIALATAKAYDFIEGNLKKINLTLDPGIFKNAYSCAIPGTSEKGIEIAAILGVLAGDSSKDLEVLTNIKKKDIEKAKKLRKNNIVNTEIKEGYPTVFVEAKIETDKESSVVRIKNSHANIVYIKVNNQIKYDENKENNKEDNKNYDLPELKLNELIEFIEGLSFEETKFTLNAVETNKFLAEKGKKGKGMKVGYGLKSLIEDGMLKEDLIKKAKILTAFAVDARMGGVSRPAMSFCGSGDHGIIATLPLVAVSEKKNISKVRLSKGIVLSYLITIYLKKYTGKLSAYCGCAVAAGTGAAAGVSYLLGGNEEQIIGSINNMGGNITGMICDGGNFGCTLKATTAAGAAVEAALLSNNGYYLNNNNGILGEDINETLYNMGLIATPGMEKTNKIIIEILKK